MKYLPFLIIFLMCRLEAGWLSHFFDFHLSESPREKQLHDSLEKKQREKSFNKNKNFGKSSKKDKNLLEYEFELASYLDDNWKNLGEEFPNNYHPIQLAIETPSGEIFFSSNINPTTDIDIDLEFQRIWWKYADD